MVHAEPRLAVVVPTDRFATVEEVARRLALQTVAAELELVLVGPADDESDTLARLLGAVALTVVHHAVLPACEAYAAGIRAAHAEIVVVGETHVFPAPDWAERLLGAYAGPWTAVVPAVCNANPGSALSWSAFLLDYGRWAPPSPPHEIDLLPTYNASYRRAALLELGAQLDELLVPGTELSHVLRRRGARFFHESNARLDHLNVSRPVPWLAERYIGSRRYAAHRSRGWSSGRRLVYAAGSPLLPFLLLARVAPLLRVAARTCPLPRLTPLALLAAVCASSAGEAVGYAMRAVDSPLMSEYELHKERYAS